MDIFGLPISGVMDQTQLAKLRYSPSVLWSLKEPFSAVITFSPLQYAEEYHNMYWLKTVTFCVIRSTYGHCNQIHRKRAHRHSAPKKCLDSHIAHAEDNH